MGRPSGYSSDIADEICRRIANAETLRGICAEEGMPSKSMVLRWLAEHETFRDQYARARDDQCDALAEEAIEEARLATNENAAAVRVRLDAIKWFAGKVAPKKYGDRAAYELTGKDGAPLQSESNPADIARRVAFMLRKGADEEQG